MASTALGSRSNASSDRTSRVVNGLDNYLQAISRYPLLKPKELVEVCQRIKQGDKEAFWTLYTANLRLVVFCAKQHTRSRMSLEERIQAGNEGLYRAVEKYDYTQGAFSTYAVWWIDHKIYRTAAEESLTMNIPQEVFDHMSRIRAAIADYQAEHRGHPPDKWLAEHSKLTTNEVRLVRKALQADTASLNAPIERMSDDLNELMDLIAADAIISGIDNAPEDEAVASSQARFVHRYLAQLPANERTVLALRFGFVDGREWSRAEIASRLRLSGGRISHIEAAGRRRLEKLIIEQSAPSLSGGMSVIQAKLLGRLASLTGDQMITLRELKKEFGVTVYIPIAELADSGLVTDGSRDGQDRIKSTHLTAAGRDYIARFPVDGYAALVNELI